MTVIETGKENAQNKQFQVHDLSHVRWSGTINAACISKHVQFSPDESLRDESVCSNKVLTTLVRESRASLARGYFHKNSKCEF